VVDVYRGGSDEPHASQQGNRGTGWHDEIVMFHFPLGTSGRAVKRVVALAGDRVAIGPRSVTVNGRRIAVASAPSPYAAGPRVERVAPGHVFLLGDNAKHSIDSRSFGAVPEGELVGRMLMTIPPW